jgi:hypothetical protein
MRPVHRDLLSVLAALLAGCSGPGSVSETIWDLALTDDTVYAPRYTDQAFASVAIGMTEADVLRRLGPPIDPPYLAETPNEEWDKGMRWTRSAGDSHYKCRVLLFRNGRVSEKHAELYVD